MKTNSLVVVFAVLLATASSPGFAESHNVIRWASQGDALSADPHSKNELPTISAARKVYDSLVYADQDLKIVPWLATSWQPIGPHTWEFRLRQSVSWQDGSSFTAEDVKFSLDRARGELSDFKVLLKSIDRVEIVNDHLIHIVTKRPNPLLPRELTTVFMMSKAWCEKHGVTKPHDFRQTDSQENYAVRHAMGTGPFRLDQRVPGERTVWTKNASWWGLKDYPHDVDKIVFTPIADASTRTAALLTGSLDLVTELSVQDIARLERTPGVMLRQTPQDRTIFLGMDQASPELNTSDVKGANPFSDVRVRRALNLAIDADKIRDKIMRGYSTPAGIITAPPVHGYTEVLNERPAVDLDAARGLLAAAGYPDGFSVQLDCPNNRYINDEAICVAVAGMLGKIGVRVKVSAQKKELHFNKVQRIKGEDTDFYLLGWGVQTLDSHYVFDHLARKGTWNATGFDDPEINALIDGIASEVDLAKRDRDIGTVWQRLKDDVVYLPIHHQVVVWAMKDWLDIPVVADNGVRFIYARINK